MQRLTSIRVIISSVISIAVGIYLVGCAAGDTKPLQYGFEESGSADAATIIFLQEFSFDDNTVPISDEAAIVTCFSDAIRKVKPDQEFVSFYDFAHAAFPDLQADRIPRSPEYLSLLLNDARFYERITPLGIRYLVFVGGMTTDVDVNGGGLVFAGPNAAIAFVWTVWDKESRLAASVLDIKLKQHVGHDIAAESEGRSWIALIGIFPIGFRSDTELYACTDVGKGVGELLAGKVN